MRVTLGDMLTDLTGGSPLLFDSTGTLGGDVVSAPAQYQDWGATSTPVTPDQIPSAFAWLTTAQIAATPASTPITPGEAAYYGVNPSTGPTISAAQAATMQAGGVNLNSIIGAAGALFKTTPAANGGYKIVPANPAAYTQTAAASTQKTMIMLAAAGLAAFALLR